MREGIVSCPMHGDNETTPECPDCRPYKMVKSIMKLRPLAGYCLIEPLDEEQTTASGLVMPDKEKEKPSKGKVVTVGSSIIHYEGGIVNYEPSPVKEGDIVTYHKWAGQDVKEGQKEYRLVKFSDLMGVYE